jgi:ferredoxin
MVSASQIDWSEAGEGLAAEADRGEGCAMVLDETRCIRCGLCVCRCPTDAIEMRSFESQGEWVYE